MESLQTFGRGCSCVRICNVEETLLCSGTGIETQEKQSIISRNLTLNKTIKIYEYTIR